MKFVVGQLVRRVGDSWCEAIVGKVYQIATYAGDEYLSPVRLVGSDRGYSKNFFIPFKWQEGDEFIITKTGLWLGEKYIGVTGKVVTPRIYNKGSPEEAPYWITDQPGTMGSLQHPLCVLESQIAPKLGTGGYPEGEIIIPKQPIVVPEKKIRFINRKEA